jgi:hypothetical protein
LCTDTPRAVLLDSSLELTFDFPAHPADMDECYEVGVLLGLTDVLLRYEDDLLKARVDVHRLLKLEAWRVAMRSRH